MMMRIRKITRSCIIHHFCISNIPLCFVVALPEPPYYLVQLQNFYEGTNHSSFRQTPFLIDDLFRFLEQAIYDYHAVCTDIPPTHFYLQIV